jgi:hypothetical protein
MKALLAAAGLIIAMAALALLMSKPAEPPAGGSTPEVPIGRDRPDETYAVNGSAFSGRGSAASPWSSTGGWRWGA